MSEIQITKNPMALKRSDSFFFVHRWSPINILGSFPLSYVVGIYYKDLVINLLRLHCIFACM